MVLLKKLSREVSVLLSQVCLGLGWIVYIPKLLLLRLADKAVSLAGKFRQVAQRHDDLWVQRFLAQTACFDFAGCMPPPAQTLKVIGQICDAIPLPQNRHLQISTTPEEFYKREGASVGRVKSRLHQEATKVLQK